MDNVETLSVDQLLRTAKLYDYALKLTQKAPGEDDYNTMFQIITDLRKALPAQATLADHLRNIIACCNANDGDSLANAVNAASDLLDGLPRNPLEAQPYLAVLGRMDGDDEDSVELYHDLTAAEANTAFIEDLRKEAADNQQKPRDIYVNYVLTSASPIEIAVSNTF
jgi:hypothetical protein